MRRELDARLRYAVKEQAAPYESPHGDIHAHCAAPIADYLDWLGRLSDLRRGGPGAFHRYANEVKRTLAHGAYRVDKSAGDITFKPYQVKRGGPILHSMPLRTAAGAAGNLFAPWFYLECQARPGDLLMIDEPELNMHPENQLKLTRLFARLVNAGLNIVISTHSDYIVRELNSMLMLNEDQQGDLAEEYGYTDEEVLRPAQVGAYLFDQQTIAPFEITPDDGIHAESFDDVIGEMNRINDGIYYELQEWRMEAGDD